MQQEQFTKNFKEQYQNQHLYLDTVNEISKDVITYLNSQHATKEQYNRFSRMLTPDRIIQFRVDWENDAGEIETNWGYRVQHNNARGPYKGGLRFDPSVTVDILKFLALEQTFKNALTGLELGSGKGGADFNPKDRSEDEIKRFCQAFMRQLYNHIGPETDVPAGDIGVGGREIGYMINTYKELSEKEIADSLTGKPVDQGGSHGRTEATGYGLVYLVQNILESRDDSIQDKAFAISGAGNVATHAAEKCIQLGGTVLSLSERDGYLRCGDGLDMENLEKIKEHKQNRGSLSEIAEELGYTYHEGEPWQGVEADIYLPCATQNELDEQDAQSIINHGGLMVAEGANMPCTQKAVALLQKSDVIFVPAKAANAGGVAVSGLEMEQNRLGEQWSFETVDEKLQEIMKHIFDLISEYGQSDDETCDYLHGANVGGYILVDHAMREKVKQQL